MCEAVGVEEADNRRDLAGDHLQAASFPQGAGSSGGYAEAGSG